MSDSKNRLPTEARSAEVADFLDKLKKAPPAHPGGRGRLIFALDATASRDTTAAAAFKQMASLSRGAYLSFDLASAHRLKDLLAAVAVYAAGGYRALAAYGEGKGGEVLQLTSQLRE